MTTNATTMVLNGATLAGSKWTLRATVNVVGTDPVEFIETAPPSYGTITVGTTTVAGGTNGRFLYDNAGVLGEYDLWGTVNQWTAQQKFYASGPNYTQLYAYGASSSTPIVAQSTTGEIAISGASRTTGSGGGASAAVGLIGWGFADDLTTNYSAWAGYLEARKYNTGSYVHGLEVQATNFTTPVDISPYNMFNPGLTSSLWVGTGGGCATGSLCYNPATGTNNLAATNASVAIGISASGTPSFQKGIVFNSGSLNGTDGVTGTGVAIEMAKGQTVRWLYAGGNLGASILSTAGGVSGSLNFYSGGVAIQDVTNTSSWMTVQGTASTSDRLDVSAGTSGNGVTLSVPAAYTPMLVLIAP
jgi:hypothetical protein